ncbi:hypothetical protein N0V84_011545, partial [Fusarium piperis]
IYEGGKEAHLDIYPRTRRFSRRLGPRRPLLHALHLWLCATRASHKRHRTHAHRGLSQRRPEAQRCYQGHRGRGPTPGQHVLFRHRLHQRRQEGTVLGAQPHLVRHFRHPRRLGQDQQGHDQDVQRRGAFQVSCRSALPLWLALLMGDRSGGGDPNSERSHGEPTYTNVTCTTIGSWNSGTMGSGNENASANGPRYSVFPNAAIRTKLGLPCEASSGRNTQVGIHKWANYHDQSTMGKGSI